MKSRNFAEFISASLLLLVGLIWGATFPVIKIAIDSVGALWFNAYRFFLAGLIALAVILVNRKSPSHEKGLISYSIILGSLLSAGYTTQTIGLAYTESGKAGFITGLFVVFVPVFSTIFFKKKPSASVILSVALGITGLALLSLGDNFTIQKGDILVLLCAVAYAVHIVIVDQITDRFDTLSLSMTQIVVAGIEMVVLAYFFEPFLPIPSRYAIFAIFLTSIFATIVAFFVQIFAQRHLGPTKTALILLSEPVFAAVFGYILLHETFTLKKIAGSSLLLASMVIAELYGQEK